MTDGSRNLIGIERSISKRVQKCINQRHGPFYSVGTPLRFGALEAPMLRRIHVGVVRYRPRPSRPYEAGMLGSFRNIGSTKKRGSERVRTIHSYELFSRIIIDAERRYRPYMMCH